MLWHGLWKTLPQTRPEQVTRPGLRRQIGLLRLVHGSRCFQVHLPPVSSDDSFADLSGSLALLMLRVRIVQLFQANFSARAMSVFKTTVQAVVSHAIAIAIARLLMQRRWNLGRQFVGMNLIRLLAVSTP